MSKQPGKIVKVSSTQSNESAKAMREEPDPIALLYRAADAIEEISDLRAKRDELNERINHLVIQSFSDTNTAAGFLGLNETSPPKIIEIGGKTYIVQWLGSRTGRSGFAMFRSLKYTAANPSLYEPPPDFQDNDPDKEAGR